VYVLGMHRYACHCGDDAKVCLHLVQFLVETKDASTTLLFGFWQR
jgi:hypothetical protein